jgi:exopolyphosphatase/pppGpp-phosphohydrolase
LDEIWEKAERSYHEKQKGDNIQGYTHCSAVEKNITKLAFKKISYLSQISIFLLSASACVHDIGKVVSDDCRLWSSDHGKRSMEMICEEYVALGFEKEQAIAVACIVSVHNDGRLDDSEPDQKSTNLPNW